MDKQPLPILRIPKDKVLEQFPLPDGIVAPDNTDIFFENGKSEKETFKDFSMFKECGFHEPETLYLCPINLELYEDSEISVLEVIEHVSNWCFPSPVIFQWNHDTDFASKYQETERYANAVILNSNTSKPIRNDIVIPYWNINTEYISEKPEFFAGLVGSLDTQLRNKLASTIAGKHGYVQTRLSYEQYLRTMAKCMFSFCPRGQGIRSKRFYECMHLSTIPVLIADDIVLPYQDEIDYDLICIRIPESKADDFEFIDDKLRSVNINHMLNRKRGLREKFTLLGAQKKIHEELYDYVTHQARINEDQKIRVF